MKKYVLLIVFFSVKALACDCDAPTPVLEFHDAKYVFEGVIKTKEYAKDFQTYTITFDVDKHYKDGLEPEYMEFTLPSEETYTDKTTSCDWSVNAGERWLVYAKEREGNLVFGYYCSNSKRLDYRKINDKEQKVLNHGNDFKLDQYIYESQHGFTKPKPISNIDAIIKNAKNKDYKSSFTVVKMYIDKRGDLQFVSGSGDFFYEKDSVFNLPKKFIKNEFRPSSEFEKEAISLVKKLPKWEIKYHKKTKIPVAYIQNIILQYDKVRKKWTYEL